MNWDDCMKNYVKTVEPDTDKINSLIKQAKKRKEYLELIPLDEDSASILAIDYYEIIKQFLIALMLKNNLKSRNHECLISFLYYKYPDLRDEAEFIYQLKNIRNAVSYEGAPVRKEYIERNKLEFKHILKILEKEIFL